jgi:hypothetical protein
MKSTAAAFLLFSALNLLAQTDVKTLGVLGDGVHDDAPALQAAIDAGHADLFFPKGVYVLSTPVVFDLAKTGFASVSGHGTATLLMKGAGPAISFKGSHEGTASPPTVKPGVWTSERTPTLDGIEIVGAHPEADGVEAEGTMQLTVTRLVVREARHAVHLVKRNRNTLIADSHLYHNRGAGVLLDGVNLHQINITNCHISYNGGGGVVSRGGNVRNLQIGSSDIEGNHDADGPPTANVWLDSSGGSIGEVSISGCTLQHTNKAPGSANIRIQGGGHDPSLERREGRATTREGNVTIGNNVFSDVQINVEIRSARGVTLTGNTFWEGFQHDLLVEDSSHVVISSNNFDRNPRYLVNGFKNAESNGILLRNCSDTTLSSNIVAGVKNKPAAVHIIEGSRLNIHHNTILDSDGAGLLLENVTRSLVSGNLVFDDRPAGERSSQPALKITGGGGNLVEANLAPER